MSAPASNTPSVPLSRATEDWADAELEAEFARLNPEIQRRVALRVLEIDALKREVDAQMQAKLEAQSLLANSQLISIPPPTGDEKLRLEGWRNGIEKYGQELWTIYHWIVWAQDGNTHGIYRLREWLESFNVPDNTAGAHWPMDIPGWQR